MKKSKESILKSNTSMLSQNASMSDLPNPDELPPGTTIGKMEIKKIGPYGPNYWRKIPKKSRVMVSKKQQLTPLLDHPVFDGVMPKPETLVPLRDLIQITKDYFDFNGRPEWLDNPKFRKYLTDQGIRRADLDTEVPYALVMGSDVFDRFLEKLTVNTGINFKNHEKET